MGRKRADLVPGETDQLTERLPRSRLQLARWATPDVVCWLLLHMQRYQRQAVALADAATHGADCHAGADAATKSVATIARLIESTVETFTLRDWQEARSLFSDTVTRMSVDQTTGEVKTEPK